MSGDEMRTEGNEQAGQAGQAGQQLTFATTTTDGIRVVTLTGEIDHHTGGTFRQALDTSDIPSPHVVVDLHQVTFMDSSGINVLITAHRALSQAGGWLRLAAADPSVTRTLTIVGLDHVIGCHDTLHQALTS